MKFARLISYGLMGLVWMPIRGGSSAGWGQTAGTGGTVAGTPRVSCVVDGGAPSDAEKALSRRDYKTAMELFQKQQSSLPEVARAGVIRTLLRQGNLKEASDQAKAWEDAEPGGGAAMETWGEVQYRLGEFPEALKTILEARKLDPCNARALLMASRIEDLLGDHAVAARLITAAHMLAPHEIEVEEGWWETLRPSQARELKMAAAKDEQRLTAEERKTALESLAHTKDYSKSDCKLVQPADHAEFHMEEIMGDANHRQSFGLNVRLDDKLRTLEIDSGASGLVLSRAAAARLGLTHDERLMVSGVGDQGGVQSSIVHAESVKIGALEFRHCPVTVFEKGDKLGIDGLIGTDFFKQYLVTLDFPARKVRLGPLPARPGDPAEGATVEGDDDVPVFHNRYIAPEMKDWTMVWRDGHQMLLPVSIGGAKDKLFVIDTGAGLMSISPAAAREVTKVHGDFDTHVFGVSGEVGHVYETQEFLVTFAHVRLHVGSMTAIDTEGISKGDGFEVSGFLGAPVLNRMAVQIDYRDNLVNFNYDAKKDPQSLAPVPFY